MKQYLKKISTRLQNLLLSNKVKISFFQAIPFWVASLLVGLMAVFYERIFHQAEQLSMQCYTFNPYWLLLLTPVMFILSWWLVQRYSPFASGSGIPQVMAAIRFGGEKKNPVINKLIGLHVLIIKMLSSTLMVIGAGVIGREGPTIQIAAATFESLHQRLPSWWPRISTKNMIIAGAASGLAAAFNTPLGGIVFAVEELAKSHLSSFRTPLFTAVIIAGLTAQGILGPYLFLGYPDLKNLTWVVYPGILLLSVICGLSGAWWSKLALYIQYRMSMQKKSVRIATIAFIGIFIALSAIFFGFDSVGSGKAIIERTLSSQEKTVEWYIPVIRMLNQALSFGVGGAGGIFAPSLGLGGTIGSVFAEWFQASPTDTNMLILAGMVAFLTGITRSPFTSAILVLEMTDRHNVIFQLMLAAMISNVIASLIDRKSFYERLMERILGNLEKVTKTG